MNLNSFPMDEYGIVYRDRALDVGCSAMQLSRAVEAGILERLDPGVLVPAARRTPLATHLLRARAAVRAHPTAILSHETAAVVHGLPLLKPDRRRVAVVVENRVRGRHLSSHRPEIPAEHRVVLDGLPVTSLELTAVDAACTTSEGFAGALTAFDSALRIGASPTVMRGLLERSRPGVGIARRALELADPESTNPGESWSRAQMIEAGLPAPRLQYRFYDEDGRFIGRSDFDWRGVVIGEFDGYGKYVDYLDGAETALDAVRREKRRHARLVDAGIIVVRWDWADLESRRMIPRLVATLTAGGVL
ncbi:hypothetical protein JVX90_05035 [Gordonia sp. PDNC005]|nr:hypothetical protein JVX90_05035 [Gordonia sp. PDNC005]